MLYSGKFVSPSVNCHSTPDQSEYKYDMLTQETSVVVHHQVINEEKNIINHKYGYIAYYIIYTWV